MQLYAVVVAAAFVAVLPFVVSEAAQI